jgi:type 2 lantibiotic biosynthesis protein LanM
VHLWASVLDEEWRARTMDPLWFTSPSWCRALTLAERGATLTSNHGAGPRQADNFELGRRRLERWRSQPPFTTDPYLAQRLTLDGLDEERLQHLLGEPVEDLYQRLVDMPDWLAQLDEVFSDPALFEIPTPDDLEDDEFEANERETDEEVLGFLNLIQPLIDQACDYLLDGVDALVESGRPLPFDPDTIEDILLMNLPGPLLMRLSRTLVLELHVARLQGYLEGDTPEERFQSFIQRLRQPENAIAILAEYPVLARQLTICINQWAEVSLEFLNRLCDDWALIRSCFNPADNPGMLVDLAGGAGDTHRGGRSVMIATFESGFRIVYKPKSLAVDIHFQELLTWLNDKGCKPSLRTLTMLDRGDYGWVEFVEHRGCSSPAELKRFYQRHGAYLALLYALNANDFHFENLIAVGEDPVLIDLETVLQPQFDRFDETQATAATEKALVESVLQVGLLPLRLWSTDEYSGIDLSGLGGSGGQLSPDRVPQLAGTGTDAMHYIRQRVELPGDNNRPNLSGVEVSASAYVDDIVTGFTTLYELLIDERAELLADNGPLSRFAQDEIRILLRPTRTYDQLLSESFHPDLLRDALERDLFLDRLWITVMDRAYMAQVVKTEQADLQQGDIPIFMTNPSSLDLWGTSGERIGGVLYETGMSVVHHRLCQFGEQDMRRQHWLICASLATLDSSTDRPLVPAYHFPTSHLVETKYDASRERLLAAAQAIAERLAATAIYGDEDASWIGLEPLVDEKWTITPLGIDLYGGLCGIALFLAYAGAITHEERYTSLARRTLKTVARQIELLRTERTEIGGFEGWGGLLYTFTHLGVLWDERAVLSQAEEMAEAMESLVTQDESFDIARGTAGALVTLLALHRCLPSDKTLRAAIACGDHLLASAQPTEQGLCWAIPPSGEKLHTELGHGVAGIAWALLELAAVIGDERYRIAARQAIAYDRALDPSAAENAPTLHQRTLAVADVGAGSPSLSAEWSLGTAGIGLARLCAYQHLDDSQLREEIQLAVQSTLSHSFGQSHSLWQGDLGNLELLLQASRTLNDDACQMQAEWLAAMILESIERNGWRCGGPGAVEMPSLMLGLAGIGYQMLRLAEPERVPSVLVLAPPVL